MKLKIEEPIRTPSKPVTDMNSVKEIAEELSRLRQEKGGLGLAAPQCGIALRLFVMMYKNREVVVINPSIRNRKGAQFVTEGCLSLPGVKYTVTRSQSCILYGTDLDNHPVKLHCDSYQAPIAEHELDHLSGILIDKIGKRQLVIEEEKDKLAFGE
jgi:peptide deformylase